jgi:hypothetical protein
VKQFKGDKKAAIASAQVARHCFRKGISGVDKQPTPVGTKVLRGFHDAVRSLNPIIIHWFRWAQELLISRLFGKNNARRAASKTLVTSPWGFAAAVALQRRTHMLESG